MDALQLYKIREQNIKKLIAELSKRLEKSWQEFDGEDYGFVGDLSRVEEHLQNAVDVYDGEEND